MKRISYTEFKRSFRGKFDECHIFYARKESGGHMLLNLSTALDKKKFYDVSQMPRMSVRDVNYTMNRQTPSCLIEVDGKPTYVLLKLEK